MTQFVDVNRMTPVIIIPANWSMIGYSRQSNPQSMLKPCPCCGSTKIHVVAPNDGCYCWDCGLTMPNRPNWRERWNKRVEGCSKDGPMDCDEGRVCPKCGKAMVLCKVTVQGKDEKTHYESWVCGECGYKEDERVTMEEGEPIGEGDRE